MSIYDEKATVWYTTEDGDRQRFNSGFSSGVESMVEFIEEIGLDGVTEADTDDIFGFETKIESEEVDGRPQFYSLMTGHTNTTDDVILFQSNGILWQMYEVKFSYDEDKDLYESHMIFAYTPFGAALEALHDNDNRMDVVWVEVEPHTPYPRVELHNTFNDDYDWELIVGGVKKDEFHMDF